MTDSMLELARTARVGGTTLAYCEQGEGAPVVFVHGGTADLRVWAKQLPVVGAGYRAISYSQRYCRPNDPIAPEAANPFDPHVDDLSALVREIGAEPAHLVGSSSGAFIGLLAAIRRPERVRSLVLCEPPALPLFASVPPRASELLRLLATRPRTGIGIMRFALGTMLPTTRAFERGDDEKALVTFLRGVLGEQTLSRLSDETLQVLRENVRTLRGALLHEGAFPPLSDDDVRGVDMPVLLVTGERSPDFLLRLTDRLEELLPRVERIEIPDASHIMFEENAPAFNEAVVAVLARNAKDR
jgi:pimeloyl-ACP methyl ester carboxylesterase